VEKTSPVEEVAHGIRTVARGGVFVGSDAAKLVVLQRYGREQRNEDRPVPGDPARG